MKNTHKYKTRLGTFILALLLLFATGSYCEAQSWQWVKG